jgi:Ca2+:H+ antiporter
MIGRKTLAFMIGAALVVTAAAVMHIFAAALSQFAVQAGLDGRVAAIFPIVSFLLCALALAGIAHIIGEATDQLGNHLGPSTTSVIQAAAASLPELFVCIFSLKAGLVTVVQSALIGSILGNVLLLLGLAFIVGGSRHGVLVFESQTPRLISILLLLAVSALVLPTLALELHLPAGSHEHPLAIVCAIVLLCVFAVQTAAMLTQGQRAVPAEAHIRNNSWPIATCVLVLLVCSTLAGLVSEWFVAALEPAIESLDISQAFAGLVIVAIAGNAVENVVSLRLAAEGRADFAVSIILNSALQVAVALVPILVLVSFFLGGAPFTLAMPPILPASLFLSVLVTTVVTVDGRADMVDGAALVGLYVIIASIFWWG